VCLSWGEGGEIDWVWEAEWGGGRWEVLSAGLWDVGAGAGAGCAVFGVWCLVFGVWCLVFGKRQMSGNVVRRMVAAAWGGGGGGVEFCKRCLCSVFSLPCHLFPSRTALNCEGSSTSTLQNFTGIFGHSWEDTTNDADAPASERHRWQEQSSAVVSVDPGWHESCLRRAVEHGLCALYQAVVSGQVLWDALAFSVSHDRL
jgi:hypothetical protein